jgi:hypothetical protein
MTPIPVYTKFASQRAINHVPVETIKSTNSHDHPKMATSLHAAVSNLTNLKSSLSESIG